MIVSICIGCIVECCPVLSGGQLRALLDLLFDGNEDMRDNCAEVSFPGAFVGADSVRKEKIVFLLSARRNIPGGPSFPVLVPTRC